MCLVLDRKDAECPKRPNGCGVPLPFRMRVTQLTPDQELRESIAKASSLAPYASLPPASSKYLSWILCFRARLLLLHSPHPRIFCAGADLRERATMSPSAVSSFLDFLRSLLSEIEGLAVPTVAVVDGYAMGGGCELALGCKFRYAGESTLFRSVRGGEIDEMLGWDRERRAIRGSRRRNWGSYPELWGRRG